MREIKVLMTPQPGARDDNGVGNVIAHYAQYAEQFGLHFVQPGAAYDVEISHAGVKDFEDPGGANIAMLHGLNWETGKLARFEREANAHIANNIRQARAVTVPSNWVGETLRRDLHLRPHVIPHGINWDDWQGGERREHMVLWAKNRADAVCDPTHAMKLAQMFPSIRFVSTYGSRAENVSITGSLPRGTMRSVIKTATVYLSTTKETFGVATLEAMAAGCPVLGYGWGGNLDIVKTGVSGYLARPGDLNDLADGLEYCLENWRELSDGARNEARKWSWPEAMRRLRSVIDDVYNRAGPSFAIVIPCYNKRDTLRQAVQSALDQTFSCEVIVVDDGSTDGSIGGIRDMPVKVIHQKNAGVAHARNRGIAETKAEFVACLDADDWIAPTFLEETYTAIKHSNDIGIAFTGITQVHPDGRLTPSPWPSGFNYERQLQKANQVPTCCLFRREIWERLGGYRQRYAPKGAGAEDAELWLRFGAIGYRAVQATTEGLFYYRLGGGATAEGYREPPWLDWHPWVKDGKHPFASIAQPANVAHDVRHYDEPLISVIIPVGPGHEKLVHNALDSLEAQAFRNWEAVVVWDTHPGEKYLSWFTSAFPYARNHYLLGDRGAGYARNSGLILARAPLIYFLDADDWLLPGCLQKHYERYLQTGKAVYADYQGINPPSVLDSETVIYQEDGVTVVRGYLDGYDCHRALRQPELDDPYLWCGVNTLIPKEQIGQIRFNENLKSLEDWEFFINLARSGVCFEHIDEPLWVYNFQSGTRRMSGAIDRREIAGQFKLVEAMGCNCGGNKGVNGAMAAKGFMLGDEVEAGYLLAEYRPMKRGKHPVWGLHPPKENYGMRQMGEKFPVRQEDIAIMGTFVCGYCQRPFQTNIRTKQARCSCSQSESSTAVMGTVQAAVAQPVAVTPQQIRQPNPQPVVRSEADRPVPQPKAEPADFSTIKGVGPATNKMLHAAGIQSFDQLSRVNEGFLELAQIPVKQIAAIMNYVNG